MEKKDILNGTDTPELKEVPKTDLVCQEEGKGRKILKWVGGALVAVATGVIGFFIGRGSNSSDDDGDSTETETVD